MLGGRVKWNSGGNLSRPQFLKSRLMAEVIVRRFDIDNDYQTRPWGGHRAVMVYQAEFFQYWSGQLKRSDLATDNLAKI
jgi:MOSC domain-containing protein YiiM